MMRTYNIERLAVKYFADIIPEDRIREIISDPDELAEPQEIVWPNEMTAPNMTGWNW